MDLLMLMDARHLLSKFQLLAVCFSDSFSLV